MNPRIVNRSTNIFGNSNKLEMKTTKSSQNHFLSQQLLQNAIPIVSVIIPVYNGAKYIQTAIESILNQTYTNYEIIVVDDGSNDETREKLKPYWNKIRYLYQENQGSAAARNLGIELAKGELIAFLDADDYWLLSEKLEKQVACFQENRSLGCINTGWQIVDDRGKHIQTVQPWHKAPKLDLETWLKKKCVLTSAMVFRREWLEKVGGFDQELRQSHDVDLVLRLSLAGCETVWLKEETVGYRQHRENTTKNSLKQAKYVQAVLDKFFCRDDLPESISQQESQIRYHTLVWIAWYQYRAGNLDEMAKFLQQSLDFSPYLRVENISHWLTSFKEFSKERSEKFDINMITSSCQWQNLISLTIGLKNVNSNLQDFSSKKSSQQSVSIIDYQPQITVLLLNFKRPQNLPRIISSLKQQTIPVQIFLWDNSGEGYQDERIDLIFNASDNQGCSPRWLMALYSKTPYIMTHDDDYVITKNDTIEKIVKCLKEQDNHRTIVGLEGIVIDKNKSYEEHLGGENRYRFNGNNYGCVVPKLLWNNKRMKSLVSSERVHLVKGRLMATRTKNILEYVNLNKLLQEREDDIAVSAMIGRGEKIHLIPSFMKDCTEEIRDEQKRGNVDNPMHSHSRNLALKHYFIEPLPAPDNFYLGSNVKIWQSSTRQTEILESKLLRFIIIVPCHNVEFLEECLQSIDRQKYKNFICVVIDDCSQQIYSLGTKNILSKDNFELIINSRREYALMSRDIAINECVKKHNLSDEDIIVHLDGDDWFAHENSLLRIAEAYADDTLVTYGGALRLQDGKFMEPFMHALSNQEIEARWGAKVGPKYPDEVIARRDYRNYPWGACHCRTFKYKLYKQINKSHFLDEDGNPFRYATDMAVFLPILEMAGSKIKYINEIIYIYNRDTGNNNVASQFKNQHQNHNLIRNKQKYPIYINEFNSA